MARSCEEFQKQLSDLGLEGLRDNTAAQEHVADCEDCFAVFDAIGQLESLLQDLPEHDASDELVGKTIEQVQNAAPLAVEAKRKFSIPNPFLLLHRFLAFLVCAPLKIVSRVRPRYRYLIASCCVLAVVCTYSFTAVSRRSMDASYAPFESSGRIFGKTEQAFSGVGKEMSGFGGGSYNRIDSLKDRRRAPLAPSSQAAPSGSRRRAEQESKAKNEVFRQEGQSFSDEELDGMDVVDFDRQNFKKLREKKAQIAGGRDLLDSPAAMPAEAGAFGYAADDEIPKTAEAAYPSLQQKRLDNRNDKNSREQYLDSALTLRGSGSMAVGYLDKSLGADLKERMYEKGQGVRRNLSKDVEGVSAHGAKKPERKQSSKADTLFESETAEEVQIASVVKANKQKARELNQPINHATVFLAARKVTEGLQFQEAAGYWANTYVPGDPTVRRLQTTLLGKSLQPLEQLLGRPLDLHQSSQQTSQPFDAPENAALAVYLHADQTGLQGERRMLVQVGIQGSSRRSGSRPAMNIGVVLDARGALDKGTLDQMREVLFALNESRDIGDKFSLILAGKAGGLVVEPDEFRHGHLSVLLQKLARENTVGLGLREAIETAIAKVSDSDDPTAPLGSSAVLLVTNQPIGPALSRITTVAHQSAVAGIPLSTIAIGDNARISELEQIALAGQGNRRILKAKDDALKLIQRELSAVSEVVARAVRLRIRMAPGTKLVQVFGSYRLGENRAERVRQAEQSIDRRLSRNLGIEADRGEDEEGIQIVIPAFYADTSHVVLLDVVAEGPGPIADVTVRYKDLVQLENGVTRANLSLGRSEAQAGPLERNVMKNLLAFRMSTSLQYASVQLRNGDLQAAIRALSEQAELLNSFRTSVPGFDRDADILTDLRMLSEYQTVLNSSQAYAMQQQQIIDSLAFAGKMKVLPSPEAN